MDIRKAFSALELPRDIQGEALQAARLTFLLIEEGPVALRPRLTTGLPFQENDLQLTYRHDPPGTFSHFLGRGGKKLTERRSGP